MNNVGLYVFAVMVFGGFAALVWIKIRWARQASQKWSATKVTW